MKYATILFFILFIATMTMAQTKSEIIETITNEAIKQDFDPDLALAIATVESGLNPKAIGALNERGLFQLRPQFHKLNGEVENNISLGISYLVQIKTKYKAKHGAGWFVLYNYGPHKAPKHPTRTKYYKKVIHEFYKIRSRHYVAKK